MTGTVTVTVHRQVMHALYRKQFRVSKKFLADSAGMDLWEGDEVRIVECRPISKNKRFKVTEIVKKAPRVSDIGMESKVAKAVVREKVAPKKEPTTPSAA